MAFQRRIWWIAIGILGVGIAGILSLISASSTPRFLVDELFGLGMAILTGLLMICAYFVVLRDLRNFKGNQAVILVYTFVLVFVAAVIMFFSLSILSLPRNGSPSEILALALLGMATFLSCLWESLVFIKSIRNDADSALL